MVNEQLIDLVYTWDRQNRLDKLGHLCYIIGVKGQRSYKMNCPNCGAQAIQNKYGQWICTFSRMPI